MKNIVLQKARCTNPDCKAEFRLDSNNVIRKQYQLEQQSIWLTYYDCPNCKKRHFVQVDDETTLEILHDLSKQICKLMARRSKGWKPHQKQQAKFEATRKHLSSLRNQLQATCTGKLAHDNETGEQFEVVFNGDYE